jgi:putative tricarboxylic transport membrane protein
VPLGAAAWMGLLAVLHWPAFGYLLMGIAAGMFLGLSVGLSGLTGLALLLPFAFGKTPAEAFALLLGMYSVTTMTDVIPAILMGIPGTVAAQAIIVDGYPMARRGQAGRAMGAAFLSDIIGSLVGAAVFVVCIPVIDAIITRFAAPEFFMLGVLGISMVGALSGRSILRGIIIGLLGLLLAMVGMAPEAGFPRYVFGVLYLWNGIPLVPAVLGLFGFPELLNMALRGESIASGAVSGTAGMLDGLRDCLRHWWLVVRCALIGAWTGLIPGLGGPVVEWLGYGHAVQSEKNPECFGQGDVRGVIAAESATVAHKPGALIPTVAFAIPGNASMAILLGAFLIVGLRPGQEMLTTKLDVTFTLIWTTVVANIISALGALALAPQLAKVTRLRWDVLVPVMLVFMVIGSISANGSLDDVAVFLVFGLLGFVMDRSGWPRPPIVLGLILGKLLEPYLFIATDAYGAAWLLRPIVIVLGALTALGLVAVAVRRPTLGPPQPRPAASGSGSAAVGDAGRSAR